MVIKHMLEIHRHLNKHTEVHLLPHVLYLNIPILVFKEDVVIFLYNFKLLNEEHKYSIKKKKKT